MNWSDKIGADEKIVWQGRPAPRCFTFRNWMHSLFGVVILIAAVGWMIFGLHLGREYQQAIYGWIPVPFLLAGIYLSFGHLVLARLEWEKVFYAMTDRRLIAVRGISGQRFDSIDLSEIIYFQLKPLGSELGTVRVQGRDRQQKITVCCVEYPRKLTDLLEPELEKNGIDLDSRPDK